MLNLAENIAENRKRKGITQEELAIFIGVTKASVSKWETGQSMPDLLLLPQLASFFDISVDTLIGYEPQMSREQIRAAYHSLTEDFSKLPFEEAMQKSEKLVKEYYSCYGFLSQMCTLWLNQSVEITKEQQEEIHEKLIHLCEHILKNCKDVGICNDVILLKSFVELMRGRPQEVIEALEDVLSPFHMANQGEPALIQAYQMAGRTEKAENFAQIAMYLHVILLVNDATQYLNLHMGNPESCLETIRRIDGVVDLYGLAKLNQNATAVYEYQAACVFCLKGNTEEAAKRILRFAELSCELLLVEFKVPRDEYFPSLEQWSKETELGNEAPRGKEKVAESALTALENPLLQPLTDLSDFKKAKKIIEKMKVKLQKQ